MSAVGFQHTPLDEGYFYTEYWLEIEQQYVDVVSVNTCDQLMPTISLHGEVPHTDQVRMGS